MTLLQRRNNVVWPVGKQLSPVDFVQQNNVQILMF